MAFAAFALPALITAGDALVMGLTGLCAAGAYSSGPIIAASVSNLAAAAAAAGAGGATAATATTATVATTAAGVAAAPVVIPVLLAGSAIWGLSYLVKSKQTRRFELYEALT